MSDKVKVFTFCSTGDDSSASSKMAATREEACGSVRLSMVRNTRVRSCSLGAILPWMRSHDDQHPGNRVVKRHNSLDSDWPKQHKHKSDSRLWLGAMAKSRERSVDAEAEKGCARDKQLVWSKVWRTCIIFAAYFTDVSYSNKLGLI